MKRITLVFTLLLSYMLSAQTSDTTFVSSEMINLNYYDDFDSNLTFPDGTTSYRKIIMTIELGQYDCDPGANFCHQWDYDVEVSLITDTDTYEMGRFITPFATSGWPRFGSDWKQPYKFDVTDFYPLLQGQKTVRLHYSGYSGGFTAKIKFAFIEGTPAREVLGIKKAFEVSHTYGDSNDPFNDYLPTFTDTPPAGTQAAKFKVLVTGHGNDNNGCCEFASHSYNVLVDNSSVAENEIWRDDCGLNELYPQGGTWLYDRGNWCPGAKVRPIENVLPTVAAGTSYDLDVQFDNYTGSGELGSYKFTGLVFYYGQTNHTLDAGLTEIVAPTTDPRFFRENPSGSIPTVKVHNGGNTAITSIDFSYGVTDSIFQSYTWNGNIPAFADQTIALPQLETLLNISNDELDGPIEFNVEMTSVNGQADDVESNNTLSSQFNPAQLWPSTFVIILKTNNIGANGYLNSNPSDVSWEITDMDGNVVASRTNTDVSTTYTDTIDMPAKGMYRFKLTSTNCYGLNWWALGGVQGYQSGSLKVYNLDHNLIPMKNYSYYGTPHDDWGCAYSQYFSADSAGTMGVVNFVSPSIKVYPNPAKNFVNVKMDEGFNPPYTIDLVNLLGRTVYHTTSNQSTLRIPVNELSGGLYILIFKDNTKATHIEKIVVE